MTAPRQPSPRVIYYLEAQRSTSNGWAECQPHQAQRFAIIRETRSRAASGEVYKVRKTIWHGTKLAEAETVLARVKAGAGAGASTPSLGARFLATGRKIIAASLPPAHPLSHTNRNQKD